MQNTRALFLYPWHSCFIPPSFTAQARTKTGGFCARIITTHSRASFSRDFDLLDLLVEPQTHIDLSDLSTHENGETRKQQDNNNEIKDDDEKQVQSAPFAWLAGWLAAAGCWLALAAGGLNGQRRQKEEMKGPLQEIHGNNFVTGAEL